jgi:hypothetical protein
MNQPFTLNAQYWQSRYLSQQTGWDIGYANPALIRILSSLDKNTRILIPGAGRAYEAIWLHQQGFTQVWICDWAPQAFEYLQAQCPDFPDAHLLCQDYFELQLEVDFILEQTFFCAIDPKLRAEYVKKSASILHTKGKLAGLLFGIHFEKPGPPFGGTQEEYRQLFEPHFHIHTLDTAQDSILPRLGTELLVVMEKR